MSELPPRDDKHGEDLNKDLSSLPVAGREKHLHNDMDAQRWAREFIKKNVGLKVGCALVDEGTMLGWFANAIMCGYDEARRREAISSEASAPSTTPRICSRGGAHEIDQCHKCGAIFAASAIAPNAEMVELARSKLGRSTRCPVFEMHYLAAEVLRLSGAEQNNRADGGKVS